MLQSFSNKPIYEKIRLSFIYLVSFYIAFMPIFPVFFKKFGYTPNIEIRNYLIIGSLSFMILWVLANFKNKLQLSRSPILFGWLAFLSYAALTILWAINPYEGYLVIIQWLGGFMLFLVLGMILRDDRDIQIILYAILIAGIITAIIGQIQSHSEILDKLIVQAIKPASTFANKNMAAHIMSLSFPIAICLFLRSVNLSKNILYSIVIAIMFSFILFTRTRAAWLGVIVMSLALAGFLIWFYKKRAGSFNFNLSSRNKLIGYGVFLITFLALIFIGNTPMDMAEASKLINFNADTNDRIPMFLNTLKMFSDYPFFGVGLGNWTVNYPYYMASEFNDIVYSLAAEHYQTHNDSLQILSETGLVGFLLIATTVYLVFNTLIRAINQAANHQILSYLAILLAIIEILTNSLASFPFQLSGPTMLLFSLFALAALIHQKINGTSSYQFKAMYSSIIIVIPLSILLVVSSSILADWKKAEQYYYRAMISWKINKPQLMIDNGTAGFNLNPMRYKLLDFVSGGYILKSEPKKALPILNAVLKYYPYRLNTLHYKAQSLFLAGKKAEGIETMKFLLSLKPAYAPGYEMLAMFAADEGKKELAIKDMKKAVKLSPKNDAYRHKYALLLIKEKKYLAAKEQLKIAINLNPKVALYHKNLGILYTNMLGQPIKGVSQLIKTLKLDPKIADAKSIQSTIDRYYKFVANELENNQK